MTKRRFHKIPNFVFGVAFLMSLLFVQICFVPKALSSKYESLPAAALAKSYAKTENAMYPRFALDPFQDKSHLPFSIKTWLLREVPEKVLNNISNNIDENGVPLL